MQYFGTFHTKYEEVFLTSSYLYFNQDDEEITANDLKQMLKTNKTRKKHIAGTVFFYNPVVTPVGYDSNAFLLYQDFDAWDEMVEVKIENAITVFKNAITGCEGKIVEIRNLFNLNEKNIDASQLLMKFNDDLEKYYSTLNTEFERDIMYLDAQNLIPSGKFVFFAWGDKINSKEFPYIFDYAKALYENSVKLGKKVAFVYKKEKTQDWSQERLQFSNPIENPKYKNAITQAIKNSFSTFPPTITSYE
ncbi:hypothetical protein [Candidatus Marinarcus aquaticus]|uniref:Uncharacterized protein n=1 Tax=Candidatus Marinarcus aquaticus TaxID=2044504 RepID=A0A4Q0XV14_9BACT|nr:hypothetical protein [Candidatus Marinarcus aquaticus]RXJ60815.1 hypothetical protein CRV04_02030 [Candidatus Marinarcus aquaticus]